MKKLSRGKRQFLLLGFGVLAKQQADRQEQRVHTITFLDGLRQKGYEFSRSELLSRFGLSP